MAVNVTNGIAVGWELVFELAGKTICMDEFRPQHTAEVVRIPNGAMCGSPDYPEWRTKKGRKFIRGSLTFSPTKAIIDHLMPYMGLVETVPANDIWELDTSFTVFDAKFNLYGAIHSLGETIISGWALRASKGSAPLSLTLNYIAEQDADSGSMAVSPDLTRNDIWAYTDLTTFDINSVDRLSADRLLIQVDHKPIVEYGASKTITDIKMGAREVVIATSVPYIAGHKDAYFTLRDDEDGVSTTAAFVNADQTMTIVAPTGIGVGAIGNALGRPDQLRTPVTLLCLRGDNAGTDVTPLRITLT